MSLATRCTACGTVFRIVEDQLRVSDGWVRCGRCSEIFDARELLFDIERDAPPSWPAAYAPQAMEAPQPPPPPPPPPPPAPMWMPPPEPEPEPHMEALPTGWPSEATGSRQEPRWVDEPTPRSPSPSPESPTPPAVAREDDSLPTAGTAGAATLAPATIVVPEFMRRAESTARWNRPAVRAALVVASLVLAAVLLLQVTLHFRHALAALHPPLRGVLQGLCAGLGCEVGPWQRIDAISIETHALAPVGGGGSYKLSLTLRNKTNVDVAAPWVELRLSDAQGTPFARRVLEPALLSPKLQQLSADSEQPLTFSFSTGGPPVSGYTVNVFYP